MIKNISTKITALFFAVFLLSSCGKQEEINPLSYDSLTSGISLTEAEIIVTQAETTFQTETATSQETTAHTTAQTDNDILISSIIVTETSETTKTESVTNEFENEDKPMFDMPEIIFMEITQHPGEDLKLAYIDNRGNIKRHILGHGYIAFHEIERIYNELIKINSDTDACNQVNIDIIITYYHKLLKFDINSEIIYEPAPPVEMPGVGSVEIYGVRVTPKNETEFIFISSTGISLMMNSDPNTQYLYNEITRLLFSVYSD